MIHRQHAPVYTFIVSIGHYNFRYRQQNVDIDVRSNVLTGVYDIRLLESSPKWPEAIRVREKLKRKIYSKYYLDLVGGSRAPGGGGRNTLPPPQ